MEPETQNLSDAKVSLYRNAVRLTDIKQDCDRMVIEQLPVGSEDVFIYREPGPNGKRRVAWIRHEMSTQSGSSPAAPVIITFSKKPGPISDPATEERLLKIYDLFPTKKG